MQIYDEQGKMTSLMNSNIRFVGHRATSLKDIQKHKQKKKKKVIVEYKTNKCHNEKPQNSLVKPNKNGLLIMPN